MNHLIKIFLISVLTILLIQFFQGKTKDIDMTYEDALESFSHYESAINKNKENPSKMKISNLCRFKHDFLRDYYSLIYHQTFYNKLFHIKPILSKQELVRLKELKFEEEKFKQTVRCNSI